MSTANQFGAFFRASRKALGLTLREFSRRNGFDPGNVSRLERGLIPPPQAQQGLDSYAKALKLEPGTDRGDRFFELAAAETGRIPLELLENREKLPNLIRKLRRGGLRHRNWIQALHLEQWADSLDARATLPQLIRRLVHATGKDVTRVTFPKGEQTQRPEWDGRIEAEGRDAFVPAGTSVWEMSAYGDFKRKAEDDLRKRTRNSLGLDKKKTTFVFVTPRKWQQKAEWCRAKNKLGKWKDVRVYDSASLEEWLERTPAVDAWLAGLVGLRPDGLTTLDEYWANLEALTNPSLKPEVFHTSRAKELEALKEWLKRPPAALFIEARSPFDAIDFVVAYGRDPSEVDRLAARALIVESREAWRSLAASSDTELLLIAHPSLSVEPEMVAEAVRQGHRVLLPSSQPPSERVASLRLPRAYRYDLEKALESSGFDGERARKSARKSGGSLTVLKRILGQFPGTLHPEWSEPPNGQSLVPVLLAGSWEETNDGDRAALEKLAGKPYKDIAAMAERWLRAPDSPLTRVLSRWGLLSRDDSWFLLAPQVTADHLRRFEQVALEVLGEDDPAYELPPDERWLASVHKKVPLHSQALRTGLAETLALLGGRPKRLADSAAGESLAARVVRKLLDGSAWVHWASLSPQLPILAEAAPEAFLEAVEADIKRANPELRRVFEQEGEPLFSSSPHTGLLWALEGLAWNSSLLSQVSLILGWLDEHDPGGKLGNRPARSLQEIFMPGYPQTTATLEERVSVLKILMHKNPAAGWRLLVNLLPNQHRFASPIYRPMWRDWDLTWSEGATNAEEWHQVEACSQLLVENLGDDIARWKELIEQFENLSKRVRKEFLERLKAFDVTTLDVSSRQVLTETLRGKMSLHRRYSDAGWALPSETLAELEKVQARFEPPDAVARNAWLFGPYWSVRRFEEQEPDIGNLRLGALREIESQSGWEGVLGLVHAAEAPEEVGSALGEEGAGDNEKTILPSFLSSADEKVSRFARGYVWARHHRKGWEWVGRLDTRNWFPEQIGRLLVELPFGRETWDLASEKGPQVEEHYWRHTPALYYQGKDPKEVAFAVSLLLEHKRSTPALHLLAMAIHQKVPLEPQLLLEVLEVERGLEVGRPEKRGPRGGKYEVHLLFQELQKAVESQDARVDPSRLAALEWSYLPLLDGHPATPVTLHGLLRENPEFFVDLLGVVFHPRNAPEKSRIEVSEKQKARATNAYRLLSSWEDVPGSRGKEVIDEKALFDWVQKARALAKERELLEVCDSHIGQVFAHAPKEPDGSWPCVPVRDTLEEIDTEDVFSGMRVGLYNKRGVYSKSPNEGGDQERVLAKTYRGFAIACQMEWPKTAATLRQVARGYEEEAGREDAEALHD